MWRKSVILTLLTVVVLFAVLLSLTSHTVAQNNDATTSSSSGMLTSNGIWLEAALPLPVFQFAPPQVTGDGSVALAAQFSALGQSLPAQQDTYLGRSRFTVANEQTNTVLEQYGATGGFYAFNSTEAFGENARGDVDPIIAQQLACEFLFNNQMMPDTTLIGTPDVQFCDFDFSANPYEVTLIHAATDGEDGREPTETVIGVVVEVPMFVKTGQFSQTPQVPLGGPGGHLSLLFRTTNVDDNGFSLDDDVVGLGAVAMPFNGRSPSFLANIPARDPQEVHDEVVARVQASYPDATEVNVPTPALLYMVSDAAQPQVALEPMLKFSGIEVVVDGQTLILRDVDVTALEGGSEGFGPDVAITAPANGSSFTPGTAVLLTGSIISGTAPYTYTWSLSDGAILDTGSLAAPGEVSTTASDLPADSHNGYPAGVVVQLLVEDSDGAIRQDSIVLNPAVAPISYLPAVFQGAISTTARQVTPGSAKPQAVTAIYRFGVEAGSDYPPYGAGGSDLPGVIPDATGFRTGMLAYGWTSTFNWWNASAWEKDWRDCSLGGGDCSYGVDRVDFAYYAGHGGPGGLSMPSSQDSSWFAGSNARFQTVRWAGFASCQTLRAQWSPASAAPIRQWFNAFQGAHMLLGFNSNMADVAFGPRLVDNMRMPTFFGIPLPWSQRTIREAWVQTTFEMNAGKPAYIYAVGTNGVNPVDNKLPMSGDPALSRPYPVASYHWVWWDE